MNDISEIRVLAFDGHGGASETSIDKPIDGAEVSFTWIHIHRDSQTGAAWLENNIDYSVVVDALLAEETRPRCTPHGNGVIVNLRGVNLHPESNPEDMVSIRLWMEEKRVISIWRRPLSAIEDLLDAIERKHAPTTPGDFVAKLVLRLADRAEPTVAGLNEHIDALEEEMLDSSEFFPRQQLADIRRKSIVLRRYLLPQKDALTTLEIEDVDWISDRDRARIREAAERITRLGEDLDAIRDRAQIVNDQIADQRAENMNKQMLLLSIVAAVFLPLGFLTGLLGINVGGMPGVDNPIAFLIVVALLLILVVIELLIFKRLGLLGMKRK